MKKWNFYILTVFIFLNAIFTGCSKATDGGDTWCYNFFISPVVKVEGPKTTAVNQSIDLKILFTCFNGCGNFGNYEQIVNGNTTTINVIAKYEGCICTQDVPIRQSTYSFSAPQAGIYFLKFSQTGNVYLTDTITVR